MFLKMMCPIKSIEQMRMVISQFDIGVSIGSSTRYNLRFHQTNHSLFYRITTIQSGSENTTLLQLQTNPPIEYIRLLLFAASAGVVGLHVLIGEKI